MALNERDFRAQRSRRLSRDQSGRPRAYDNKSVSVRGSRIAPTGWTDVLQQFEVMNTVREFPA